MIKKKSIFFNQIRNLKLTLNNREKVSPTTYTRPPILVKNNCSALAEGNLEDDGEPKETEPSAAFKLTLFQEIQLRSFFT